MRVFLAGAAAALIFAATGANAACLSPAPPGIPDGKTASADQMNDASVAIKAYIKGLEQFQACIKRQDSEAPPDTTEDQRKVWLNQYNNAVDKMEETAGKFNEQLRAFKARKG